MHIGIHAGTDLAGQRTGVEEYIYQLLHSFPSAGGASGHTFSIYVRNSAVLGDAPSFFIEKPLRSPFLWTQGRLMLETHFRRPDILFVPGQIPPLLSGCPYIMTVHGLEFLRYPEKYSFTRRWYLRNGTMAALRRARGIIAVSDSTKKDLTHFFGIEPSRIRVIHHGYSVPPDGVRAIAQKEKEIPFILYIGRIETKKNVDGMVSAFEVFKRATGAPHQLVLAGKDGFGNEKIRQMARTSPFAKDIIFRGYITQEEKWRLLSSCKAFIFTTWYEGFGMPILEAQAARAPVITSATSSMPEVAGEGAFLVDPARSEEIAKAIEIVLGDGERRARLVEAGQVNLVRFSWKKCAQETLDAIISS